jgi:hypothetical protein
MSTSEQQEKAPPIIDPMAPSKQGARVGRAAARAARHSPFYRIYNKERAEGQHNSLQEHNQRPSPRNDCRFFGSLAVLLMCLITIVILRFKLEDTCTSCDDKPRTYGPILAGIIIVGNFGILALVAFLFACCERFI